MTCPLAKPAGPRPPGQSSCATPCCLAGCRPRLQGAALGHPQSQATRSSALGPQRCRYRRHGSPAPEHGAGRVAPPLPASAISRPPKPPIGDAPASGGPRTLRRSTCMFRLSPAPRNPADVLVPRRASLPIQLATSASSGGSGGCGPLGFPSNANLPSLGTSPGASPTALRESSTGGGRPGSAPLSNHAWGGHAQLTSDRQTVYDLNGHQMQTSAKGLVAVAAEAPTTSGVGVEQPDPSSQALSSSRSRAIAAARAEASTLPR